MSRSAMRLGGSACIPPHRPLDGQAMEPRQYMRNRKLVSSPRGCPLSYDPV